MLKSLDYSFGRPTNYVCITNPSLQYLIDGVFLKGSALVLLAKEKTTPLI